MMMIEEYERSFQDILTVTNGQRSHLSNKKKKPSTVVLVPEIRVPE